MPTVKDNGPKTLHPYEHHGIELHYGEGDTQAVGDCPFCAKSGSFSVNIERGVWRCFKCSSGSDKGGGNALTFLRLLHEKGSQDHPRLHQLAKQRKLLLSTLIAWGVRMHPVLPNRPMIPGYNQDGKLCNLYLYTRIQERNKKGIVIKESYRLRATKGLDQQLYGVQFYDAAKSNVMLLEGPWDGMQYYELSSRCKWSDGVIRSTSNPEASLLADTNVLAVPGASIFFDRWCKLFDGKNVYLGYDSDHLRHNGPKTFSPGFEGMRRAVGIISKSEATPLSIKYLHWGEDGFDPNLKDGYDVGDLLGDPTSSQEKCEALDQMYSMMVPAPGDWVLGGAKEGAVKMEPLACSSWKELILDWRKALKMNSGLESALCTTLAAVMSVHTLGEPIWLRLISPPSTAKSTFCEAITISRQYVIAKSTLTGFHSGYISDKDGDEDHSLLSKLNGKALVTKDADTLFSKKNLGEIMAQARDIFDGTSRSHYGHGKGKDYEGFRTVWIVAGTNAMYQLDSSELGERWLTCKIMDAIDDDIEDDVLWTVANRAERNVGIEVTGTVESKYDTDMVQAMRKTGGYVDYLCKNAAELLSAVDMSEDAIRTCMALAKMAAYMRARPSKRQEEVVEREFAARLVSQITRLAKCTAAVLNRGSVDDIVMARVSKIALDTAQGRTLQICKLLHEKREQGCYTHQISVMTHHTPAAETRNLTFLRRLGAVERFTPAGKKGEMVKQKWRLSTRMIALFDRVFSMTVNNEDE